jgi:hypothetical protein
MLARAWGLEQRLVLLIAATWFAHLLAYVWIVPPWRHYDEPTHFEYAALIREQGRLNPTGSLPELRRAIAASMIEAGFYRNQVVPIDEPNLDAPDLALGIDQRRNAPTYYALVAAATIPFRDASITTQLYVGRLVSVALAMLLFGAAYLALRLLFGDDWELRCATLAALALQPAFTDNMSAVNNDALANLVAVLMLLGCIWFLQRPDWRRLLVCLVILVLALNVKRTLLIYGLIVLIARLLAAPVKIRIGVLLTGGAGAVIAIAGLLAQAWPLAEWQGNTYSYISTHPLHQAPGAVTASRAIAPYTGSTAIALQRTADTEQTLSQNLFSAQLRDVGGTPITLAAWMRADRDGLTALAPVLVINDQQISRTLTLSTRWQLVIVTADAPQQVHFLGVELRSPNTPGVVVYDELALVRGGTDNLPAPSEIDGSFEAGLVSEEAPRNLLRNAGAERHIPPLLDAPLLEGTRFLEADSMPRILSKLFDPAWTAAVYPRQSLLLFQSAWGVFGWGEIGVSNGWFAPLGLLVLLSLVGAARFTWRQRREERWRAAAWWLCLTAVVLGWGAALLRVHNQPFPGVLFWSFGRYTFVAMLPSMIVFIVGLREIFPRPLCNQGLLGVFGFLIVFALVALFGVVWAAAGQR